MDAMDIMLEIFRRSLIAMAEAIKVYLNTKRMTQH
jgi:hypothetical protein